MDVLLFMRHKQNDLLHEPLDRSRLFWFTVLLKCPFGIWFRRWRRVPASIEGDMNLAIMFDLVNFWHWRQFWHFSSGNLPNRWAGWYQVIRSSPSNSPGDAKSVDKNWITWQPMQKSLLFLHFLHYSILTIATILYHSIAICRLISSNWRAYNHTYKYGLWVRCLRISWGLLAVSISRDCASWARIHLRFHNSFCLYQSGIEKKASRHATVSLVE